MGIVFRQSIKTTLVTFTGALLGALINYVYVFVFTQRELGFYTNTLSIGAVMQLFVMMGMGTVLSVFIQKYPERDERRKTLMTVALLITLGAITIFGGIFLLLKDQFIGQYKPEDQLLLHKYYYYIPLLVGLWGIGSLLEQYLISQIKIAISAFVREVVLRLCNMGLIGLYYFKVIDFSAFIALSVLIYAIPIIILYLASSKTKSFGFSSNFQTFSKPDYREIFHFAWYHLLFGMSQNLFGFLDFLLLARLDKTGFESLAVYRLAIFVATIMIIPYRAMAYSAFPIINKAYIDNNREELQDLFKRSSINICIVVMAVFAVIICNLDNLVAILPPQYASIKPVVLILLLGKIVDISSGLNNEVISISEYYKFNFRISGVLLLAIFVFDVMLIPQYGIYGAAWGTTIAYSLVNIIKMLFLWKKMQLQPFSKGSLTILICAGIAIAIGYILPFIYRPEVDTIIRSIVIFVIYGGLLLWLKPSEDLRKYLLSVKTNKRLF